MTENESIKKLKQHFEYLKHNWKPYPDYDTMDAISYAISALETAKKLKQQLTAYDIDEIVEHLKTDSSVKLYGSGNSDNYLIPVKRAIEIIKESGNIENSHDREVYLTALEDYHRLISEECKSMLIKFNPQAFHLKEYNDEVLVRLKAGGNY